MSSRAALAATRSLDVLSFLAANPNQPYSLTELARALDVNPSSMFGILNAMTQAGYLTRHPFQKTYRLGPVAASIGIAALHQDPSLELASDEVTRLGLELATEAVVVSAIDGDMLTLACAGPPAGPFLSFVGQRVTHGAPVGSIFAAWADDDAIAAWLDRAKPTLTEQERNQYSDVLQVVRQDAQATVTLVDRSWRFAVEPDRATPTDSPLFTQLVPGTTHRLFYVGVPVFDPQGAVMFGLFATGTSTKVPVDRIHQLADRLHDAALGIMGRIGSRIPEGSAVERRRAAAR